jgi:hypothetical protein
LNRIDVARVSEKTMRGIAIAALRGSTAAAEFRLLNLIVCPQVWDASDVRRYFSI